MKLFLIGLPGSGKSTLGVKLAELLNFEFLDTDELIVKTEGMTINEIFHQFGEDHFRRLEEATLKQLNNLDNTVISTGGGLPCFYDNMNLILSMGFSIYLNVSPEIITERLYAVNDQSRPMVKGKTKEDMLAFLIQKCKERTGFYNKANLEINGVTSAEEVIKLLKEKEVIF
ncbi:MAG: shikimate kinase [Sporocytophaga sp.]|uniref:shikimate kinase n=1 Tax=Sporocytophaga sp. TaxID=2231183 RepID=UPI001B19DB3D|nr:shikimate kinase [Sporocytophaga sp.]MBO9699600.1 shikimate kinase [Sporocytophaga sp.]